CRVTAPLAGTAVTLGVCSAAARWDARGLKLRAGTELPRSAPGQRGRKQMARREMQSMSGGAVRPTAQFRSQTGRLAATPTRPPFPFDDRDADAGEHRRFPRARLGVRFDLWMGTQEDLKFSAALRSDNLSVSGAFLESTFFLPIGTEI